MKIYALCAGHEEKSGLRLSGVEAAYVASEEEVRSFLRRAKDAGDCGCVLYTASLRRQYPNALQSGRELLRESLFFEIPDTGKSGEAQE